jgi:hypothetical protein
MMLAKEIRVDEDGRRWKESTLFSQTAGYQWLLTLVFLMPVVLVWVFTSQTLATDWFSAETYPYYKIARGLVEGHGYAWYRSGLGFIPAWEVPPLYPCLMGFIMSVLGTVAKTPVMEAFRWLNLSIFLVDLTLLFYLLKQWMPRSVAWMLMVLVGVTPVAQTVVTNLSAIPLFWLFTLVASGVFAQLVQERTNAPPQRFVLGLLWAMLALATHTAGGVVLITFLAIMLRWGGFQRFLVVCGLTVLLIAPWLGYSGYIAATLPAKFHHVRPLILMDKTVVTIPTKANDWLARLQEVSTQVSGTLVGSESQSQVGWPLQYTKDDWFSSLVNGLRSPFHQNQPLHWLTTLVLSIPVLAGLVYWAWSGKEALLGVFACLVVGGVLKQFLQPVDDTLLATMAPWLPMLLGVYLRGGQVFLGWFKLPIFTQWGGRLAPILAGLMVINTGLFMLRQFYVTAALSQQQPETQNIGMVATAGKGFMKEGSKPSTTGVFGFFAKHTSTDNNPQQAAKLVSSSGKRVKLEPGQHEIASTESTTVPEDASVLAPIPRERPAKVVVKQPNTTESVNLLAQFAPPLPTAPASQQATTAKTVSAGVFPISQLRRWVQRNVANTAVLMTPNPSQASFFLKRATVGYPTVSYSATAQQELLASLQDADYLLEERGTVASQWVESVQALSGRALRLAYQDDKGVYRVWQVVHPQAPTPPVVTANNNNG